MKIGTMYRGTGFERSNVNEETRTVSLTFSSEEPANQSFGREILSHNHGAVDLSRLNSAAPLLWNHNPNDLRGVVEMAYIGNDKRGHATVRFSNSEAGDLIFRDVKDGIVRWASVGYRVKAMKQTGGDGKNPEFTVTKWQPYEISLVAVPVDFTVGIGRSGFGGN